MNNKIIAVYGTLRKGRGNHRYFMQKARFISNGILNGWAFCQGKLTIVPCKKGYVEVEVYEVDHDSFCKIDRLEGYPYIYTREKFQIVLDNGDKVNAWVYYVPDPGNCYKYVNSYIDPSKEFNCQE